MARTKNTARKSTGGKAPHKVLAGKETAAAAASQKPLPPQPAITYFWDRIIANDFNLEDAYTFSKIPASSDVSTHHVRALHADSSGQVSYELCNGEQESFRYWLIGAVNDHEAFNGRDHIPLENLPHVTFDDSLIKINCVDIASLQASFACLNNFPTIAAFKLDIEAKGFPFQPAFWTVLGLPTNVDEVQFIDRLQAYLDQNQEKLGKVRGVWARFSRIANRYHQRFFAGALIILTDEATILEQDHFLQLSGMSVDRSTEQPELW